MKQTLVILNIAGLLGALIWLMSSPGWEPLVTTVGLVAALIALLYSGGQGSSDKTRMTQKGGKGSTNYQAKGDITVNIKK